MDQTDCGCSCPRGEVAQSSNRKLEKPERTTHITEDKPRYRRPEAHGHGCLTSVKLHLTILVVLDPQRI